MLRQKYRDEMSDVGIIGTKFKGVNVYVLYNIMRPGEMMIGDKRMGM